MLLRVDALHLAMEPLLGLVTPLQKRLLTDLSVLSSVDNLSLASKLEFESFLRVGDPHLKMRSLWGAGGLNSQLKLESLFALTLHS